MASSSATRQQLYRVTYAILNSNSLHFIPISFLFLPLTFFASASLRFYFSSSQSDPFYFSSSEFDPFNVLLFKTIIASSHNLKTLTTLLAFTSFIILPTVVGTASIIYATHQAIHRKPLTFSSTFKSLSHSFLPLLYTFIAGTTKLILLILAITLSSIAVTEAVNALGFDSGWFNYGLFFSIFVNSIVSYALAITIVFCVVIWGSAAAITVLESKSGFETLQQSANQSTEFRHHSFSVVYLTGFVIGLRLSYVFFSQNFESTANWILNLQAGVMYLESSMMILMYVVANTVLYVQCKVERVQQTVPSLMTVTGEFSDENVKLLVNDKDGEVLNELAMVYANGGFTHTSSLLTIICLILFSLQILGYINGFIQIV